MLSLMLDGMFSDPLSHGTVLEVKKFKENWTGLIVVKLGLPERPPSLLILARPAHSNSSKSTLTFPFP